MRQFFIDLFKSFFEKADFGAEPGLTWTQWLCNHKLDGLFPSNAARPHLFDQLIWAPRPQDRRAAWDFYTELCTRITTQPLPYRSGDEDKALESVFNLFDLGRSIIRSNYGCSHFATLTMEVLNRIVRPFTAKWHRMKVDGRLASTDVRFTFRLELAQLQAQLRSFAHLLKLLIGDESLRARIEEEAPPDCDKLFDEVPFGVLKNNWIRVEVGDLRTQEESEVLSRRRFYQEKNQTRAVNAIGLSISGGGIRSATFALGVVQVLARKGIFSQVDFLSTVSGGGYLGSFISSYLNDPSPRVGLDPAPGRLPFGLKGDGESQGVRHLRNHSKYLNEGGWRTRAAMAGLILYGISVSALLLSLVILMPALAIRLLSAVNIPWANIAAGAFSKADEYLLLGLLGFVVFLPVIQLFAPHGKFQKRWQAACIVIGAVCIFWKVLEFLRSIVLSEAQTRTAMNILGWAVLAILFLVLSGLWLGTQNKAGRVLLRSLAAVGPLLVLLLFFGISSYLNLPKRPPDLVLILAAASIIFIYTTFILNINYASPHLFYRNRLAQTYLTRSLDGNDNVVPEDPQPLSQMNASHKAPYHLINAALNIPGCTDPNLRGRNTDFFLFSKCFCGSPIVGYKPTMEWENGDAHLDLGTAMAISGAAAAPQMGTGTSSQYTFLLAMLNVRLGYWLRRPVKGSALKIWLHKILPPVAWNYFFRELTGRMNEKTKYLNVSDGGHIENLGIYELLRRKCKFIIAIDGEADPKRSFGGLLTLTQLVGIDLGVRIEPDLSDLRIDRDGLGKAHFGLSKIEYADGDKGLLLYIKSSLTGNESEFLQKYQREHPEFPHQSTAQQLFSETQFEAYRALGEHIAGDLFRPDLVGGEFQPGTKVDQWFRQLAVRLL